MGVRGHHSCCLCQIGVRLIHLALESCYLDPHELPGNPQGNTHPVPALSHEILQKEDRKQGMIKLHDVATRRLNSATDVRLLPPPWPPWAVTILIDICLCVWALGLLSMSIASAEARP